MSKEIDQQVKSTHAMVCCLVDIILLAQDLDTKEKHEPLPDPMIQSIDKLRTIRAEGARL